jgi:hypothetical protein
VGVVFSIIGEDPTTSLSFLLALICSNRLENAEGFSGVTFSVRLSSALILLSKFLALFSSLSFQSFLACSIKLGPADITCLGSSLVKYSLISLGGLSEFVIITGGLETLNKGASVGNRSGSINSSSSSIKSTIVKLIFLSSLLILKFLNLSQ